MQPRHYITLALGVLASAVLFFADVASLGLGEDLRTHLMGIAGLMTGLALPQLPAAK